MNDVLISLAVVPSSLLSYEERTIGAIHRSIEKAWEWGRRRLPTFVYHRTMERKIGKMSIRVGGRQVQRRKISNIIMSGH